jgi:hypothetical protein
MRIARRCAFRVQGVAQKPSEPVENWSAWIRLGKNLFTATRRADVRKNT